MLSLPQTPFNQSFIWTKSLFKKKIAEFLNFLKFFMNGFSKEKNHKIVNSLLIDWNIRHSYYVGWFTLKIQNFRPHGLLKILNLARKKWVIHRIVLNKPSKWTVTLGLIYELDGLKINNWGRAKLNGLSKDNLTMNRNGTASWDESGRPKRILVYGPEKRAV